ncbi:MAG: glycosyltransferase family 2 protein [Actinomycetes bacterium]|jgi:glycosyltransferase involved in cell wall biosynthesis|nr:MAG: glycosyltransferase family 2 protein [Actinomycetota bacterium]
MTAEPGPDTLVSIGLPVRNAADRVAGVIRSVLAQDHGRIELVISDNASTDRTEEVCRDLAATDDRIVYHRQPYDIGLLNNFIATIRLARGEYFRWIGDDDRLEPCYVSRLLREFAADPRLILVTSRIAYTGPDGKVASGDYTGTALRSDDPVERLGEMLRLLNESHLLIDPLYGMVRRAPVAAIPRRNMLREDEVFACKLALAGPWGHVPEVLAHRHWKLERIGVVARRLGVPAWRSHFSNTLQFRELLGWIRTADLTPEQRRRARAAICRMYARRQRRQLAHRTRKVLRLAGVLR